MLYRFRKAMRASDDSNFVASAGRTTGLGGGANPTSCNSIPAALRARRELRKSLSRQIMRIQDASLESDTIRRLNDQINESLRTVRAWDECLLRLGHRMEREEGADGALYGNENINVHGYWYFGRARELPGVRELLQEQERERGQGQEQEQGRPRGQQPTCSPLDLRLTRMMERADDEYFGKVTDDATARRREEEMEQEETIVEGKLRHGSQLDWITGLPLLLPPPSPLIGDEAVASEGGKEEGAGEAPPPGAAKEESKTTDNKGCRDPDMGLGTEALLTIVPTQEQVGTYLVERRREELLHRYAKDK